MMNKMNLNEMELEAVAGGNDGMQNGQAGRSGYVKGLVDGYLAVRSSARPGADNQIGGLLNGQPLTILGPTQNGYIWIKAYCGKTAWTNETGWQTGWADARYVFAN